MKEKISIVGIVVCLLVGIFACLQILPELGKFEREPTLNRPVVKLIIDPKGMTPEDIAKQVRSNHWNVNEHSYYGHTPLHNAAIYHPEFTPVLLDLGADINAKDDAGNTALHCAAYYQEPDAVTILLARGANKKIKNKDNKTAIEFAKSKYSGSEESKRVLYLLHE